MNDLKRCQHYWKRVCRLAVLAFSVIFPFDRAWAHKPSDSYLTLDLKESPARLEWHLALRDLEDVIGLDKDGDGTITWNELHDAESMLVAYAQAHLSVRDDRANRALHFTQLLVDRHSDGAYAVLRFECPGKEFPTTLHLNYTAFFDVDPTHRGLLRMETALGTRLAIFAPGANAQTFSFSTPPTPRWQAFLKEGMWHIWTGYDHLLFLLVLLLPGALTWRWSEGWQPQPQTRSIVSEVLRTVTAFTAAHSVTLTLAALDWVRPPSRVVESLIAASIIVAAINNLRPSLSTRAWAIAFAFGLIHGFGFANALADLGLHGTGLAPALLGFNLGVETGQLAVVGFLLPLFLTLRHKSFYRRQLMPIGSLAIAALATTWLLQRALDIRVLPF